MWTDVVRVIRYFYDLEFLENGATIDLISIGIVADDGREYYAVASDAPWEDIKRHHWLVEYVLPQLPGVRGERPKKIDNSWLWSLDTGKACVKPRWVIANEVRDFLIVPGHGIELWGEYCAYDHVALMQLWGPMS